MLTISLDRTSGKSMYIQLYEKIKNNIITKVLAPDSALPSKRSLASHLGISLKTVANS